MEYEFVKKYLEPKKTGNVILDLNPMSKLNLMFVFGLLPFLIQNYWFGLLESAVIVWSVSFSCKSSVFSGGTCIIPAGRNLCDDRKYCRWSEYCLTGTSI